MGRLWTSLADYFIRRGMFERARDVYEEGLTSVMTVRDFSLVYDALTQVRGARSVAQRATCGSVQQREACRLAVQHAAACRLAVHPCLLGTRPVQPRGALTPPPRPAAPPACLQFEESLISAKMEQAADEEEPPALEEEDDGEDFLLKDAGDDLDMR